MSQPAPKTITIDAETPAYGGLSVGRLDGKVVFIKGAIPGETVEAAVEEDKKDYCRATAVKILTPSPDRTEPPCIYYGRCGGCHLQHVVYGRQVRLKEEVLKSSLMRIAGMEVELDPSITGRDFHYRRRARFKICRGTIGFYRDKSHEVVEIASCPLMAEGIDRRYAAARPLLRDVPATGLHISCGSGEDDAVAVLMSREINEMDWDGLSRSVMGAGFTGVTVLKIGEALTYGREYIKLDLSGLAYTVSAAGFFQANWEMNLAVVRLVLDTLGPLDGLRVVDLYSGSGNFALPLAAGGAEVAAIEGNPAAVADGERNMSLNGIKSCRFIRTDADAIRVRGRVDVMVVDPPRVGIAEAAMARILSLAPARLVYMSCDPATFSRDIKRLSAKYKLDSVRLADFFPQTYHMESLAFLSLR